MLEISVLLEDGQAPGYTCEHGLSLLLRSSGGKNAQAGACILFDTGESGACVRNAEKMGLDLAKVTEIVISHGHHDHGNGLALTLPYLAALKAGLGLPPIIAHPEITLPRRIFTGSPEHPQGWANIGINAASLRELAIWPARYSREPLWLRENIVFLGQIPQKYPHLAVHLGEVLRPEGGTVPDCLADDSALAYITPRGLVIVAGCSHSGIVNIIDQARSVTGVNQVHALFGGLHFRDMAPEAIRQSIDYLRDLNLAAIWAAHCTEHDLDALPNQLKLQTGQKYEIEF